MIGDPQTIDELNVLRILFSERPHWDGDLDMDDNSFANLIPGKSFTRGQKRRRQAKIDAVIQALLPEITHRIDEGSHLIGFGPIT